MALLRNHARPSESSARSPRITLISIFVGLASVYGLRIYTTPRQPLSAPAAEPAKIAYVTVPLASRSIPAGTGLTMDDVAIYKIREDEVGKYSKGQAFMTNPAQIIGKTAKADIAKGSIFTTDTFFPAGQRPGIAARLEKGLRAVTISMTVDDALNGYASPGQTVDVLFHYEGEGDRSSSDSTAGASAGNIFGHHDFNPPRRRDYYGNTLGATGSGDQLISNEMQEATTTVAQGVKVLAVGAESVPTDAAVTLPGPEERVSLTLAVTPRQAELLNVAKGHGRLSLTLRNETDQDTVALVDPVTIREIIRADTNTHEMEIYRGQQLTRLHFTNGNTVQRQVFESEATLAAERGDSTTPPGGPLSPTHTTILPLLVAPGGAGNFQPGARANPAALPESAQRAATETLPVLRPIEVGR